MRENGDHNSNSGRYGEVRESVLGIRPRDMAGVAKVGRVSI